MTYKPPFVVLDFETEEGGRGSTEFYRPSFRVSSAAFSWLSEDGSAKSEFIRGENAVSYRLERIAALRIPLVAHNAQFEMGVLGCRYPQISTSLVWLADTMRLVQVFDNGGDPLAFERIETLDDQLDRLELDADDDTKEKVGKSKGKVKPKAIMLSGLGLVKAVYRILQLPDHKEEAHEWIRANVSECRKGREGGFLNRLPTALLERYNVGDTEATLKLYTFITSKFQEIGYDWRLDHQLYFASVRRIVDAKIRGVAVDRLALETYREATEREIADIGTHFRVEFLQPIIAVERGRMLFEVRKRKTLRGRKAFVRHCRHAVDSYVSKVRFNVGSNKQLEALFVGQLRYTARFLTDSKRPSFRSAVLSQWGPGGEILKARRKRLLVLKQTESLLDLTKFDERWHCDLKACGTATGRFAGGQA